VLGVTAAVALTGCGGSGGSGGGSDDAKARASASSGASADSAADSASPSGASGATSAAAAPPAASPTAAAASAGASGVPVPPAPPATGTPKPAPGTLPSRLEPDGTTITVGDPAAPHTISVYEDPRCPVCARFEKANGAKLTALATAGRVRLQYTLASFLDDNLGGGGSKRAVNALRAAVAANRFAPLHALVYARQPEESRDGFTVPFLLQLAGQVPGLRGPAFDAAVRGQTYASFVSGSEHAFVASGVQGTPTVSIDGKRLTGDVLTPAGFEAALKQHGLD
jgi:protein-disulfide isomerase